VPDVVAHSPVASPVGRDLEGGHANMSRNQLRSLARYAAVVFMDGTVIAATALLALKLRLQGAIPDFMAQGLRDNILLMVLVAILSFQITGLYRRAWRYVSIPDLVFLLKAVTIAETAIVAMLAVTGRSAWLPTSVPLIHWSMALIGLAMVRIARRSFRDYLRAASHSASARSADDGRAQLPRRRLLGRRGMVHGRRALIIGEADWADLLLKQIERYHRHDFAPVGLIDPVGQETNLSIRGVPLLGSLDGFEAIVDKLASQQRRPQCVIVNSSDPLLLGAQMVNLVARAERLGLEIARAPDLLKNGTESTGPLNLEFLNFSDLLDRPERNLDPAMVSANIRGSCVMVTGAGGSIGSELARQIASFAPEKLILLDAGEYNLYAIDLEMRENFPDIAIVPILCSVRQREHVMAVFDEHRPELVFHAAALKHVPLVEQNPCSGIQTNVIGTRIIADAARRVGARAMIQVSTDKAVNPIGIMGASKRLGELYCQALDLAANGQADATRFVTVRFGNVLGSSGSLIPLFMRQLSHRGPLTVTHPEMERFFMTIHEAVHLILHSSAQALLGGGIERGRIFVLDMGEPVKIVDIARRMIRLAGLEPDRDIAISFVGLRPGEKLFEELFNDFETRESSSLAGVFEACPAALPLPLLQTLFDKIELAAAVGDTGRVLELVRALLDAGGTEEAGTLPLFAQFDVDAVHQRPEPTAIPVRTPLTVKARAAIGRPAGQQVA